MKRLFLLCLSLFAFHLSQAQVEVPEKIRFCDMDLTLNHAARQYIGETIAKLKPGSTWFNALAERAAVYFPYIEDAFAYAGVPDDLKYIVLQESSLNGNAVSTSNAVGFWQMKEASAREMGLVMNRQIDERRHIYRSSLGAARYFFRVNRDFDNWVYAIIGYNRGPVGALPFLDEKMYGKKSMVITGNTHWYALKAIAYKLAFEDAVANAQPTRSLEEKPTGGETSLSKLARANGLEPEELRVHNPWVLGDEIPQGQDFTFYLPREGAPMLASNRPDRKELGVKQIGSDEPDPTPPTKTTATRNTNRFSYLPTLRDPDYGLEYVQAAKGESLVEIAVRNRIKVRKLQEWNGFGPAHRLQAGEIVYLKAPKKAKFHIVAEGENLPKIAEMHQTTTEKLRSVNRMKSDQVFAGQKLYLKKKRPKHEKIILLELIEAVKNTPKPETKEKATSTQPGTTNSKPSPTPSKNTDNSSPSSAKTITHTVKAGETLWRISQQYGVDVEAIRKQNRLSGNNIYVGQQLRIPK